MDFNTRSMRLNKARRNITNYFVSTRRSAKANLFRIYLDEQ